MRVLRKIKNNNNAVAGIVVAIMIVGLVIAIISILQTVYVPKWMEERESEHMEKVAEQFSQLKFALDSISVTEQSIPITTPITLGSKELGFLMSTRAFGALSIQPEKLVILTEDGTGNEEEIWLDTIKYSSENAYYLDQTFVYEGGATILSQNQGNVMIAEPSFTVTGSTYLNISMHVVNIVTVGGKTSIGGYGTYSIKTEYLNTSASTINGSDNYLKNLTIETGYPLLWYKFINSTFSKLGLSFGSNPSINDYYMTSNDEKTTIYFYLVNAYFNIKVTDINVQIGPGWVE